MQTIEYRDVPDFPGYRVGSDGSLWSCWGRVPSGKGSGRGPRYAPIPNQWHRMNPSRAPSGRYFHVSLSRIGQKRKSVLLHLIVIKTFRGNPKRHRQCRHLNDDRTDNRIENLVWGTAKQNGRDRVRNGKTARGAKNGGAKLTADQVVTIRERFSSGATYREVCQEFQIAYNTAYRIKHGMSWANLPITPQEAPVP